MVHIGSDRGTGISQTSGGKVPRDAKIEFVKLLPTSLQGKIVQAEIQEKLPNGNYKLLLKDGQTLEAKIEPAPKVGSSITFLATATGKPKITEMILDAPKKEATENGQKNLNPGNDKPLNTSQNQGKEIQPPTKTLNLTENKPVLTPEFIKNTATDVKEVHKNDPFKQLRPLIGQKIELTLPKGQTLPHSNGVITVVVSKPENGLQTLQPKNNAPVLSQSTESSQSNSLIKQGNLPPFQAKFPTIVPTGTVIKMDISSNQGKILDITPPKDSSTPAPVKAEATTPVSNIRAQTIILTSKVSTPEAPLPKGAEFTLKITSKPETLPNVTSITTQKGEIKPEALPQNSHVASSKGSVKFNIVSQTTIPEGTTLTVKINNNGSPDIIKVNNIPATPSTTRPTISAIETMPQTKIEQASLQPLNLKIGSQHIGIVQEQTPEGKTSITLNNGQTISIKAPEPLILGSKITVIITDDGLPEILQTQALSKALTLAQISNKWGTLIESVNTLKQISPQNAEQLKGNLPNLDKDTFLPNLISFIDSVNNQSMTRLAGEETINLLKAMGIDFSADMNHIHTASQKNADQPESWRSLLFPYIENEDSEPKQGGFFWNNKKGSEGEHESTRFIVHLDLTALGAVQIDGFVQKRDIRLKLSTTIPLEKEHEKGIKSVVRQTLEKLEMTGDIMVTKESVSPEKPLSLVINESNQYKVTI